MLDTALGLNPVASVALAAKGFIRFAEGQFAEGEELEMKAMYYGPQSASPPYFLAQMCAVKKEYDKQLEYLIQAVSKPDAQPDMFSDLAQLHLARGEFQKAAEAYRGGLKLGLDTNSVKQQLEHFPQLRKLLSLDTLRN